MRWRFEKRSEVNDFDAFEQRPLFPQQKGAPYGELTGAANLFLAAGTATVLSPIVPVRDDAAYQVCRCFYEQLRQDVSLGLATRRLFEGAEAFQLGARLVYRLYGLPDLLPSGEAGRAVTAG